MIQSIQYELQVFETEDHGQFRTLDIDGEPWFVLGEVCRAVGLQPKNGSFWHHAERLDADEKRSVTRSVLEQATSPFKGEVGGRAIAPTTIVINESGLYSIILRSEKPEAKRFKKWITSEVLPSIRRSGAYVLSIPRFIRRFNDNWERVSPGCFSIISEAVIRLWGRLEQLGHVMADISPDGRELRPVRILQRLSRSNARLVGGDRTVTTMTETELNKRMEQLAEAKGLKFAPWEFPRPWQIIDDEPCPDGPDNSMGVMWWPKLLALRAALKAEVHAEAKA